jgi:hypothetical protein
MTLQERWDFVLSAIKEGYILRQWNLKDRVYLATYKNKEIGVYVDEITYLLENS